MADLYGAAPSPAAEPEEISTFLHQLLHNSSSSSPSKFMHHQGRSSSSSPQPPGTAEELLDRPELESECGNSGVNFSDPGGYIAKDSVENAVSSVISRGRGVSVENDIADFSCDSEKGAEVSEIPSNTVRPRSSSKRSRAAEVHNLSEKRRRSRINEKMKALQNLIPNSNKTDKASMLDEAIEYLKQLQLQVQMLTMRNGLSLHPLCLPGVLQPMQLPLMGISFDDGNGFVNTNPVPVTFSANEESSEQTGLNLPSQCTIANPPIVLPSGTNITSSENSFGFEPLIQVHHGPFNRSMSSKEVCRESTPQAQFDTSQAVKTSPSGVS